MKEFQIHYFLLFDVTFVQFNNFFSAFLMEEFQRHYVLFFDVILCKTVQNLVEKYGA